MVCLTTSKLFRGMLADELPALEQTARLQAYRAGSNVFQEGDPGDGLYIIVEGKVQITCLVDQEQRRVLSELGPGDFFGEMALLDNEPRSATIIATEPLEIATIWRSDFLHILSENFSITQKVLAELSRRLRNASNRIESLATMDVYGRLARFFLDAARTGGKVLDNGYVAVTRPTHQAIANMIGTSRETVSRLIHDLMKQNLLLSEGKTIYLRKTALDQFRAEL